MSADDFQTKYASVMESMLKSAIAETTKLFETMVDELKAEISRIKKENEDLKTRCSQFERGKSLRAAHSPDPEPPRRRGGGGGGGGGSEKRDTAVQCDLVPFRTMRVEECQPMRNSSLQNQHKQCSNEEMEYGLLEHNYETLGEGNSQMAFILVKQEESYDDSLQPVLKQEEVEPTVFCSQITNEGSPQTSECETENEGHLMNQESSTGEMPEKEEETQVALELPFLGINSNLQGAQNQSSEPGDSLVISLAAIEHDTENGQEGELVSSEEQPLVIAQLQSVVQPLEKEQPSIVPQQCEGEDEISVNEQTDFTLPKYADLHCTGGQLAEPTPQNKEVACEELKNGMAEDEASSHPVHHRRGWLPKKATHPHPSVKEILALASADVTTEREVVKSPSVIVEEFEVPSAVNTTASDSPQAFLVKPKKTSIITPSVQERANTALGDVESSKVVFLPVSVASLTRGMSEKERPCYTSVNLQDAMLLVEAMNQSKSENTISSSGGMVAAPPQTQCSPCVGILQTLDKVLGEKHTSVLPTETLEAAGSLPITELPTTQLKVKPLSAPHQVIDSTPTSEAQVHFKVVMPKQQHEVIPSNTTTPLMPSSTAATQTSEKSQQHVSHPLITLAAPSKPSNAIPHKIIVMPRSVPPLMPHKNAALSQTKLPTLVSAVVAAQDNSLPPASTSSVLLGTNSFSSLPQKTIYVTSRKSLPVVPSHSTATSTDLKSGIPPHPKITIIIPRQVSAVASRTHQSQTVVLSTNKESAAVTLSKSQLISSSQKLTVSVDAQTASNNVAMISSQKRDDTTEYLESCKQTAPISGTTDAPTEICSSLKISVPTGPIQDSLSPLEQKLSAVVKLTRLPYSVSTKESVLVSRVCSNGYPETESILKEGTTQKKPSSVVISKQTPEMSVVSTDICRSLKETSVHMSTNTSQMSEEPNNIQELSLLSSETCNIFKESYFSGYVQPFTQPKVSAAVLGKTTVAISTTELSADEPAFDLEEEVISKTVQDCTLPNEPTTAEKQSAALIQLTPMMSKDTTDPHVQMTKIQFLAQLAVSPIVQTPKKDSANDFADTRASSAETSPSDKERLQTNSFVARLRSHPKTHLQTRRTETSPEPCKKMETPVVSPKKPRLENDGPNDKNTTSEPIPISPKKSVAIEGILSLNKTTNDPISNSPMRTRLCKDSFRTKRSVSEPTRRSKATSESTHVSPRRSSSSRYVVGSKNRKSTSVSPRMSRSTKDGASPKKTKSGSSRKNTKSTPVSYKGTSLTRDGASLKQTKSTYVSPRRSSSTRDCTSLNKTESFAISPGTSSLSENRTSLKISTSESISVIHRRSTFSQDASSIYHIKRESSSFSPRRRTPGSAVAKTKSETGCPSVRWPKMAKDGISPRKTGESTPTKKPRLIQDGTSTQRHMRVLNAKKLAKAAKAKSIAKMKISNQPKLQDGTKTSQLAENQASCEAVKKYTAKAVWIPPRMPASKKTLAGVKRSSLLPVKKETRSSISQSDTVVYPPSVSLHPIPVKAPPIISPLQPLSVIGGRLLKNQCGECGRILSSSAALESHVSLHTGRRPFSCTLCGKSFPDSKGLKRHGRVHRNGRIHICQQCGKGFVYRFGLTKHLQMVHSRIKPFVCQICNKGFFTKRDVEAHIRIHTGEKPFHCNLCEKKFTRRVELNVHLRWHNGEKRHWCPYCGKGFLDLNNLKRHKYIHTGEKPHSCPHCSKHFTQSGHLKKHVKNVHKIQ